MTLPLSPEAEEIVGPPPPERPRRRALFVAVAIVAVVLIVGFAVTRGNNDAPTVEPNGSVSLAAERTNGGLTVTRTWSLTGDNGDEFVAQIEIENPTDAAITDDVIEVIPKSVTNNAADIHVEDGTAAMTVVEADPILRFEVAVPARAQHEIVMRVRVPADGATTDRVLGFLSDRRAAVGDYVERTSQSSTTTPASTSTAPNATTAPGPNQPPVIAFNGRTINMGDNRIPSWDHFWIYTSVKDPENDPWTFNSVHADSTEDIYTGSCSEDIAHGCIWYWDNGLCGVDSIWVTVKDSHGNVSNEDVLKADYC